MEYHILNGDALKDKFPNSLEGECIVLRECLVDGPVKADSIDYLYAIRAQYLENTYGSSPSISYKHDVIPELNKLRALKAGAEVYLWFEDDLFCQVNLWFALYFLNKNNNGLKLYLVQPYPDSIYGFGGMNEADLTTAFKDKTRLTIQDKWSQLWPAYQDNDFQTLDHIGQYYLSQFPFLSSSINAHKDRNIYNSEMLGRPEQTLIQIIKELNNPGFGPVFQEFCKREAVYGFGDIHVKRLYDKVIDRCN